ncbi:N-acetylneuraminate synthase family protein [Azospirillum argentinense]
MNFSLPFLESSPKPIIIAEIGAKYASLDIMQQMVQAAKECGADLVKFQTYQAETISTPGAAFTMEDGSIISQYDFFKAYELSEADHAALDGFCRDIGIGWLSTPSHPNDVTLLERFDPPAYKTGSDDLTNLPFLRHIAEQGRPMIVSTGMCTLGEVEKAVETIVATGNRNLVLLHCVVSYPARREDANLRAIQTLQQAFGFPVGLSDHTTDEFTSVLATALGAVVIEKHLTLDHALKLPDHQASLDPAAFQRLVERVRLVPTALGDGVKRILPTEEKWRRAARKSLFAIVDIPAGTRIEPDHLTIRRPSDGIHPHHLELVVGRSARTDISAGTLIAWNMLSD